MKLLMKTVTLVALMVMTGTIDAYAARNAKVIVDSALVYEFPKNDSAVIGKVTKDLSIQVSNQQTNGFFKTRITSGAIGWISGVDILVTTPEPKPEELNAATEKMKTPLIGDSGRIQLTGGLHLLGYSGLPATIVASDAKTATGASLELQFLVFQKIYLAGRVGYLTASGSEVSFTSVPLQAGLTFVPFHLNKFRIGVGAYAGLGLFTKFKITKNDKIAEYESIPLIGAGNVQLSYQLAKKWSLLMDVDYRLQSMQAPASSGTDGLQLPAYTLNLGGLAFRLGLEIRI